MSDRNPNAETQAQYDERVRREVEAAWAEIDDAAGYEDDWCEPVGSCESCDSNLYEGDDYDGLCSQCAWYAERGDS